MRARFLDNDLGMAPQYDVVILWCGNNDWRAHPFKASLTAESPEDLAASLVNFEANLEMLNLLKNIKVFGLIPPLDVKMFLEHETIFINYRTLMYCNVSARDIQPKDHFEADGIHLNKDFGLYHAGRLFEGVQSVL